MAAPPVANTCLHPRFLCNRSWPLPALSTQINFVRHHPSTANQNTRGKRYPRYWPTRKLAHTTNTKRPKISSRRSIQLKAESRCGRRSNGRATPCTQKARTVPRGTNDDITSTLRPARQKQARDASWDMPALLPTGSSNVGQQLQWAACGPLPALYCSMQAVLSLARPLTESQYAKSGSRAAAAGGMRRCHSQCHRRPAACPRCGGRVLLRGGWLGAPSRGAASLWWGDPQAACTQSLGADHPGAHATAPLSPAFGPAVGPGGPRGAAGGAQRHGGPL